MNIVMLFILGCGILIHSSKTSRILGIISTPTLSHHTPFRPIWKELSLRGHQVTVITSHPMSDPSLTNLTEISTSFSVQNLTKYVHLIYSDVIMPRRYAMFVDMFLKIMLEINTEQLFSPVVKELIENENEHFDLVMAEYFQPAMLAFGERFKCPVIGLMPFEANSVYHEMVGNPVNPTLYPDFLLAYVGQLSFFERLTSVFYLFAMKFFYYFIWCPELDKIVAKSFGEGYASVTSLANNVDMLFLNANPVINSIRPSVPSVIHIGGGLHMHGPKPLPWELQEYLDSAEEGFIYVSFGSNIRSADIPDRLRTVIVKTLSELPYKILWKFEADTLADKPDNVRLVNWLPQQDVLRHPNIKLFVMHGGLQSMEEAIYYHVPLIVMPFIFDTFNNARKIVSRGHGLSIDRNTITKESFKESILEVINNPTYRNKAKELAAIAFDEPMSGLEKAVWWTEYVLRHKGAKHLRSSAIDVPWYQYLFIDIIAFVLVILSLSFFSTYKVLKFLLNVLQLRVKRKIKSS